MKKAYQVLIFLMLIAIVAIIISMIFDGKKSSEVLPEETIPINLVTRTPEPVTQPANIARALVVKMIALLLEEKSVIAIRDREIDFADTSSNEWYDKYFNTAIVSGLFSENETLLRPLEPTTYEDVSFILEKMNISAVTIPSLGDYHDADLIQYADWILICEKIIEGTSEEARPEEVDLYVFATPSQSSELKAWEMATDQGKYSFEGINIDIYNHQRIKAIVRGREIIYIKEVYSSQAVLNNAYIVSADKETHSLNVFMGGVEKNLLVDQTLEVGDISGKIADVIIEANKITALTLKDETKRGVVKMISENQLEIEGIGKLPISDQAKFYDIKGEIRFLNYESVLVGYDTAIIVINQNEVVAALIVIETTIENIRVAINNTGFATLVHENVQLNSTEPYKVIFEQEVKEMAAGDTVDLNLMEVPMGGRVRFEPSGEGKMQVLSIERGPKSQSFHPSYRGFLEVEKVEGGYIVVNEVNFEEYIYGVVPSEMPSSYGLEAAKVQAICARSYAFSQMQANRFCSVGAHVDDSVICQVYNNTVETSQSIQAVQETQGILLCNEGQVITANFFSTSCGFTANSGDVWAEGATAEFPATSASYLQSSYQNDTGKYDLDLKNEENFNKFIKDTTIESFDADFPWYRWTTMVKANQLEASINQNISKRYQIQSKLIKTLDEDDIFRNRTVTDIGELQDLWVYSRGEGGIITELVIQGSNGVYKIATEYNIRLLLAPKNLIDGEKDVVITKKDGSTVNNLSLLPSAFFAMEKIYDENGKIAEVYFYGGGYGHGVGLSQNGVKAMVDLGYEYEEILKHYYAGTQLIQIEEYEGN